MEPGPSETAEAVVELLTPPACREHVLGDLRERNRRNGQYLLDAARTLPLVIVSRIRRTTDPQLLLMEAFALYLAFLAYPWVNRDVQFLLTEGGLLRLALPVAVALYGLVLAGAYADPRKRSPLTPVLQSCFAIGCAYLGHAIQLSVTPASALPRTVILYGCLAGWIVLAALRFFFAQGDNRPSGAS